MRPHVGLPLMGGVKRQLRGGRIRPIPNYRQILSEPGCLLIRVYPTHLGALNFNSRP